MYALSSVCDITGFDHRKQEWLLFSIISGDLVYKSSVKSWILLGGKVMFCFSQCMHWLLDNCFKHLFLV